MGPRGRFYPYLYHGDYIGLLGTGFMQVFYLGRVPRTKETLPEFLKWRRVTRQPLVFRRLTGSQRTPGFGASQYGPGVVVVNCWDMFCTLGKAPRTKKILPDFHEWYRITRHLRVFQGLMGCQRTSGKWGVTLLEKEGIYSKNDT